MAIYRLGDRTPHIPASAYVAPEATIIGSVRLGERASVWPGAVLRADGDTITVGDETNIQDGAVLHVDPGCPLVLGTRVTVGHQATLHGCTIGDGSLVGLQAVILNRAAIGRECLVAAGAVVTEGKAFPDRSLIVGAPAKVLRALADADVAMLSTGADVYVQRGASYRELLQRIG
jgi:carbonic anhydrase/acetyltransferase-like protein (isoleucine patch superfamily)